MQHVFSYRGVAHFDSPRSVNWELSGTRRDRAQPGKFEARRATLRGNLDSLRLAGDEVLLDPQGLVHALAFLHEPALRRLAIGTPFNHDPVRPWEAAWYYPGTTSWRYRGGRSEPAGLQFTQDPKTGRVVRFFVQPRPGMPHQVDFLEQAELRQGERCPFEATP